jgi:effector-binding domain-containing protein
MIDVRLREVPEQLIVTEQRSVDQATLEKWLPGAMARVATAAEAFGGVAGTSAWPYLDRAQRPDEPVFTVIYDGNPNEGEIPVEVCAAVLAERPAPADVAVRRIPAHREAYARVTKQQVTSGQLGAVYEAVEGWVATQGLQVDGPPRETFWTDFGDAAPDDQVFDVAWPVR